MGQMRLNGRVARRELPLVRVEEFEILLQDEEVFSPVVSGQCCDDLGFRRMAPIVAVPRQVRRVLVARHDVAENAQAGDPRDRRPSWGLLFYTGDKFPQWRGQIFVGGLSGLAMHRLAFKRARGLLGREALLTDVRQRIRDVRQRPDGRIYAAADSNPGGILRIEPAAHGAATAG
jgi:hypothetical protein